jgi:uncharacterized RDD family membrane protein YckC
MATTQPHTHGSGMTPAEPRGTGWITLAGVMLFIAASANALWGIAAFANDDYFAADELLFGDLSGWGAVYLAVALTQLFTAVLIFNRSRFGATLGIIIAGLNAVGQLMAIGAYPVWSVIVLVIDGLIIYGLCLYGFERP